MQAAVDNLDELAREAFDVGKTIDLTGCVYGPSHVESGAFADDVMGYYTLLAGLVRSQRYSRVCELGTHYGGATVAMARGFGGGDARLVTVDVTALQNPAFAGEPRIERVQGDVLSPRVLDDVAGRFDRHIDLLFIDIVHGYHQTKRALGMYANRLKPKMIVLDDVHLNGGMRALWLELLRTHECKDVTELCQRGRAGMGILLPRYPSSFPEGDAWRVPLWSARRAVAARLPMSAKAGIGVVLDALPRPLRKLVDIS